LTDLKKKHTHNLQENSSSGGWVVPSGHTDRQGKANSPFSKFYASA